MLWCVFSAATFQQQKSNIYFLQLPTKIETQKGLKAVHALAMKTQSKEMPDWTNILDSQCHKLRGDRKKDIICQIIARLLSFSKFSQYLDALNAFKCKECVLADGNDKMQIQYATQLKAPCGHIGESLGHATLLPHTRQSVHCDSKKAPYTWWNQLRA